MKNLGCLVPVSFILAISLLLSGCATQFGTFDKSAPRQYVNKHHPFHARTVTTTTAPVAEATTAPVVAVEQPKKKGFWRRFRSYLPFKKKDK